MNEIGIRERVAAALTALILSALFIFRLPVWAEEQASSPGDIHSLLEKSLSVVEIDKEIARIQEERHLLLQTMTESERELAVQETGISDKRDKAGNVLRAYYTGERDLLFGALFNSKSWTDFFRIADYIDMIVAHDKFTIEGYIGQYNELKERHRQLSDQQLLLEEVERKLTLQKERILALESELSDELAGRSDAERIAMLMKELTSFWESKGLAEVREYFQALALAMTELPSWVQDNRELLESKGLHYKIRVPEDRLNEFLRQQDDRFRYFAFSFDDNTVTAHGERDGIEITVAGSYSVVNEPINGIVFSVDKLLFNGFALPDTTRKALEKEFDLGFYPSLIFSFLRATSVEATNGELIVSLSFKL